MGGGEIQEAQRRQRVAALIQRLASKKLDDATAVAEIQALSPEDFDELLKSFLVLIRYKRIFPLVTCGILISAVGVEIVLSQNGAHLLGITGGLFALAAAVGTQRASAVTTRMIARLKDVRVVGALAQALLVADRSTQPYLVDTLTEQLPNLREADASFLSPKQRAALNRALLKTNSPGLLLALLEALKRIGDSASIPYVVRLTRGGGSAASARPDVQKIALECLEVLEENEARKRRQETLVRAAEPPSEQTLLRPASSGGEAEPQRLLRPASTPEQTPADTHNPTVSDTEEEARLPLSN